MKEITYDDLKNAVRISKTRSEVLKNLGLKINGGAFRRLRFLLEKYEISFEDWRISKEEYNKNRKHCLCCGKELDFEHRMNIFCSSSCAAKYNNKGRIHSEETKKKISESLSKNHRTNEFEAKSKNEEKIQLTNESKTKERFPVVKYCEVCGKPLTGHQRKYCSSACKYRMYSYTRYNTEYSRKRDYRGHNLKYKYIVEAYGGKCSICGYDKNLSALVFHHLRDKKFVIDSRTFDRCPQKLLDEELSKCVLVCQNCHHEIHHPELGKEYIEKIKNEILQESTNESCISGTV